MKRCRWPLHPSPYPDESLSSWMYRLAKIYGYSRDDLLVHDLGFDSMSPAELDIDPPELLLKRLAERCGISEYRIRMMSVQGWVPLLVDGLNQDRSRYTTYVDGHSVLYPLSMRYQRNFSDWIPWVGTDRFNGNVACPLCLQEGPEPYSRLIWSMSWITSCPVHEVLLADSYTFFAPFDYCPKPKNIPAPPEILTIDRLTLLAIKEGTVSLPRRHVHGGVWLRLLRALIEELSLPTSSIRLYKNVKRIWNSLGLETRQGVRNDRLLFEKMDLTRQLLLMRAAGVAVRLLMEGEFKKTGDDAQLFKLLPINHEDYPSSCDKLTMERVSQKDKSSSSQQAWSKLMDAVKALELEVRLNVDSARMVRKIFLGQNPTPKKIEEIDQLFRDMDISF